MTVDHRYPFAPLAALLALSEHQAAKLLGLSGKTEQEYRRIGMSERVADRLAVKAGLIPYNVWPEMAEHAAPKCEHCGDPIMLAQRASRRFCRARCRLAAYRATPKGAEVARAAAAKYYAENGDYCRREQARRDAARRA